MSSDENVYDIIKQLYGKVPKKIKILEAQINVDVQMNYLEISEKFNNNKSKIRDFQTLKSILRDHNSSDDDKKKVLVEMANIPDVEAYREVERFCDMADPNLKDWAYLALSESRMSVESFLLDEDQLIVSSGLGGKDDKLRYFIAIANAKGHDFNQLQQDLIQKEFKFEFSKQDGEIEKIEFHDNFCTIIALMPLVSPLEPAIAAAIDECNNLFGDFIQHQTLVSNSEILKIDQLLEVWKKVEKKED